MIVLLDRKFEVTNKKVFDIYQTLFIVSFLQLRID